MSEKTPVAIVTGASRGAGRGIAIALGAHGCTVYVTGRSEKSGDHPLPGTIYETAQAVTAAGGQGIAVRCDAGDDEQVKALIAQVEREQGHIDILVNNAAAIYDELNAPGHFWEKPLKLVDLMDVGLRSGYDLSVEASMVGCSEPPMRILRGFCSSGFATCTSSTPSLYSALTFDSSMPCGRPTARLNVPKRRSNR